MVEWWFWDWGWLYDTINDWNGWIWIDGCWRSFCGRMKSKRGNGRRGLLDGSGWNSGGGLLKTDGHFSLSFFLFLYICVSVSPILAESENERGCALTRLKWHRSFSLSSVWALGVGAAPPVTSNDHLGRYINSSNEFSIHLNPAPWINPIYLSIGWKVSSFLISFSPPLKAGAGAGGGQVNDRHSPGSQLEMLNQYLAYQVVDAFSGTLEEVWSFVRLPRAGRNVIYFIAATERVDPSDGNVINLNAEWMDGADGWSGWNQLISWDESFQVSVGDEAGMVVFGIHRWFEASVWMTGHLELASINSECEYFQVLSEFWRSGAECWHRWAIDYAAQFPVLAFISTFFLPSLLPFWKVAVGAEKKCQWLTVGPGSFLTGGSAAAPWPPSRLLPSPPPAPTPPSPAAAIAHAANVSNLPVFSFSLHIGWIIPDETNHMDDGTLVIHIKTGRFIALNAFNAAATWNVIVNFIFHWNELSFYKISKKKKNCNWKTWNIRMKLKYEKIFGNFAFKMKN